MSGDTYAVGVVGCGGMGHAHATTYDTHERTEVVAAADLDDEARTAFAEEFDVDATYEDHAAMLAAEDLDVVSVCTLHSTHAALTVDAAEAGVDGVFCEKPMATSLGEAEDMVDAAERNGVKLTVGHQRRFDPVHERARDLVADGAIGEVESVAARKSGGLLNWGTHMVDLTRFVLGDPDHEWVFGQFERTTDRYERGEPIEDRCLGQVAFESGARLTLETDTPGPAAGEGDLRVYGSGGVLSIDLGSSVTVVNEDGRSEYAPDAERRGRLAYVDQFLAWLDGDRDDHRCSGARALDTMEILMSVYESRRTGGVVHAPLETRASPLKEMLESGDLPLETPGKYDIRLPYASVRGDD
jgi:predicted dehydrogenase